MAPVEANEEEECCGGGCCEVAEKPPEKSTQCFNCKQWVPFGYVMWLKHLGQRETIDICAECHDELSTDRP